MGNNSDIILISGDITNDETIKQYNLFEECLKETIPNMKILSVAGNHDIPITKEQAGIYNYLNFQDKLLKKIDSYEIGIDGAYTVYIRDLEIIGLQAVIENRRFLFEDER